VANAGLLEVRGLSVRYRSDAPPVLGGLDLRLAAGEALAVVGPSGCGKSTLCRALLDLLPAGASLTGSVRWQGTELTSDRRRWHGLRGRGLGLLLQDHRYALNPVRRIGDQVAEVLRCRRPDLSRRAAAAVVPDLLAEVRLPAPAELARRYPHQLSGGQRQRACLAAVLAAAPRALLADEPTTALDLLVQRDIIGLLRELVARRDMALLLVTHDHDLVERVADRVLELQPSGSVAEPPRPAAPPRVRPPILWARDFSVAVATPRARRVIVHPLDLVLAPAEALGLAGESGAGKTTLARALAGWLPAASGSLELVVAGAQTAAARRRAVQLVSQDAVAALDPRQTVAAALTEAARAAGADAREAGRRARDLLREVDLTEDLAQRRPDALSGGQRQRVQLARALAAEPRVVIADEPASSLDPERRRQMLALLRRVLVQRDLALLLISHDLALLEHWCEKVAVLHAGVLVEVYRPGAGGRPWHPFARALAAAAPARWPRVVAPGKSNQAPPPDATTHPPRGCPYARYCRLVQPACRASLPVLRDLGDGHLLRCPLADHQAS
jgi:ABC-type glutathione transport system ATPase component